MVRANHLLLRVGLPRSPAVCRMEVSASALALFLALALLPRLAWAQGSAVTEAFQEGLYLQHTRGQVPEALSSYERAIGSNPLAPPAAVLLQRAQCQRLLRRDDDARKSIKAMGTRTDFGDRLGAARDLPAGVGVVAFADLERLGLAPLLTRVTVNLDDKPVDLAARIAALGVDPRTAVQRVSLGVALGDGEARLIDGFTLHLEGALAALRVGPAADALAELLRLENLRCDVSVDSDAPLARLACGLDGPASPRKVRRRSMAVAGRGVEVIQIEAPGEPAVELWLTAVDERTLAIGSRSCVQAELEVLSGSRVSAWTSPKLAELAEQIRPAEAAWILAAPVGLRRQLEQLRGPLGLPVEFPEVEGFLLSAALDPDLVVRMSAWATEAEGARTLADLVRGGIALVKLALAADKNLPPELGHVLDSLALEVAQLELRLSLKIPRALLRTEQHPQDSRARVRLTKQ